MDRRAFLTGATALGAVAVPAGAFASGSAIADQRRAGAVRATVEARTSRGSARVWWSVETTERVLALTFDDGPTDRFTPAVLDVLDRYDVPASFFLVGENVRRRRELVERMQAAGHELANHTFDHRPADHQHAHEVRASMERGADAVAEVVGHRPRWFRPVKGHVTGAVLRSAAALGHDIAIWSATRGGPSRVADHDIEGVRRHLTSAAHEGAIVLLHDGVGRRGFDPSESRKLTTRRSTEVAALPAVIEHYLTEGFRLVTISELIDEHGDS